MKYIVIDEDGQLRQRTAPRYDVALRDVGPEGHDRVGFPAAAALVGPEQVRLAGFVNDVGAQRPSMYNRNLVGTCALATFGAHVRPYFGPVVFTGWDATSSDVEIETLTDEQVAAIREVHADIRIVLDLGPGALSRNATPRWQAAMRRVADVVWTAAPPTMTVLHDDDAIAYLRGGGRRA